MGACQTNWIRKSVRVNVESCCFLAAAEFPMPGIMPPIIRPIMVGSITPEPIPPWPIPPWPIPPIAALPVIIDIMSPPSPPPAASAETGGDGGPRIGTVLLARLFVCAPFSEVHSLSETIQASVTWLIP